MVDVRILLSGIWAALMLNNLWGDVLAIISGDTKLGKIDGVVPAQGVWFGIAVMMLGPIVMLVLTLTLKYPAIRWANIIVAIFYIVLSLAGLSGYSAHHKFLIIVGVVFNVLTIWYAWKWVV
jgi:hypothetical protein